jgi:hypothetical protein
VTGSEIGVAWVHSAFIPCELTDPLFDLAAEYYTTLVVWLP